jgi:uridine kinase
VSVAAQLAHPDVSLRGGAALGTGWLYNLEGKNLDADAVKALEDRVKELIAKALPILVVKCPWQEAVDYCETNGQKNARALLESRISCEVELSELSGVRRLRLNPILPCSGDLDASKVALIPTDAGFIAHYGSGDYVHQPSLLRSFSEHQAFGEAQGVSSVAELNGLKGVGRARKDFVLACEYRQEQLLSEIARRIHARFQEGNPVRIICIAGPTSSGKTTFATKLCIHLQTRGLFGKPLTVDHYYLPLDRQPKYQPRKLRSDVDYDSIESMDVELVGQHLNSLVRGESVMTPVYDMVTGYRKEPGVQFDGLKQNGILVIEGIHALNPLYTQAVERGKLFKVYISPLSALQVDDVNKMKTTDHRLLRRMSRDYLFRGHSASKTLSMWDNVRRGEGTWIFPHQNDVDFVMNSACEYEIPILKTFLEPLLRAVRPDDKNFGKAQELLRLLDNFVTWPPELAPKSALLREFIGDGDFDFH